MRSAPAFQEKWKKKNSRKCIGFHLMFANLFKKIDFYLKAPAVFFRLTGFFAATIGFVGAMLSIYQFFPASPSDGELLRSAAAECRAEGYRLLKASKQLEAEASFQCAEQKFKEAIDRADDLSLWGLSNLYGDETVQPFLKMSDGKDLLAEAAAYWCKARRASVPLAAGNPPFIENLQC